MSTIVSHSSSNILETVRDRGSVPKDHQHEMAYGELVTPIRLEPLEVL